MKIGDPHGGGNLKADHSGDKGRQKDLIEDGSHEKNLDPTFHSFFSILPEMDPKGDRMQRDQVNILLKPFMVVLLHSNYTALFCAPGWKIRSEPQGPL